MALRCLLFSSDEGTAAPIREVLAGLGVEGEHFSEAVLAVEKISSQPFQIVIIDWDMQPEAGLLLSAARERKASERPLTLAIVSDDASVPKALQAGANSILRKPIAVNQAKDTLQTARDLLRARQEAVANGAHAAAAAAAAASPTVAHAPQASDSQLRAGDFLQSTGPAPSAHFDTESEMQKSMERSAASAIDPLKELEPMAAAMQRELPPSPPPPLSDDEPRGLAWYMNRRAGAPPAAPQMSAAPAPAPVPPHTPAQERPELLGFDQDPSYSEPAPSTTAVAPPRSNSAPGAGFAGHAGQSDHIEDPQNEQKREAQLFAYIAGENQPEEKAAARPRLRLGRGAIGWALTLAACAVVTAPQAPWHPQVRAAWGRGQRVVHSWLNPQLVTVPQAPVSHEDFGRAGDEYKLPVAEPIPDATTDPSQIRVTPVIDPTAKKPNDATSAQQPAQPDGTAATPIDPSQSSPAQAPANPAPGNPAPGSSPAQALPAAAPTGTGSTGTAPGAAIPNVASPAPTATPTTAPPASTASVPAVAPPPATATVSYTPVAPAATPSNGIPASLRSQMASSTPDASGNKPPDSAMSSIEPVVIPESTERALLTDQPPIGYPANARGQQGTVTLQVLVGRDGSVQDAKFLQGSLAFAYAAIDGVKLWKFKPYIMNSRPVSVQVPITISFKPGQ